MDKKRAITFALIIIMVLIICLGIIVYNNYRYKSSIDKVIIRINNSNRISFSCFFGEAFTTDEKTVKKVVNSVKQMDFDVVDYKGNDTDNVSGGRENDVDIKFYNDGEYLGASVSVELSDDEVLFRLYDGKNSFLSTGSDKDLESIAQSYYDMLKNKENRS